MIVFYIDMLSQNMLFLIVFGGLGVCIFFYLLGESVVIYAQVMLVITILWGCAWSTVVSDSYHLHIKKTVYESVAQIETCPFDTLHNGPLNCHEITVSENIAYPEDKVISFVKYRYKYEVENHNGKSIVVAIFLDEEEIDFP